MAVFKAINKKTNRPQTMNDLNKVIDYIYNPKKTVEILMGGKECMPKTAYEDFELLKKTHNKMDGRIYCHYALSFHKDDNISSEQVKEVADKFLEHPKFKNFQVAYAVHIDKPEKHFHLVVNSVGLDGSKWRLSTHEMLKFYDHADELCRAYGTSVIDRSEILSSVKSMAECKLIEKNSSWKEEMKEAITLASKNSINKNDFVGKLKALGYEVKWTKERQRIIFTSAEGNSCSDTRLGEAFGKNQIRKMFEDNYKNKGKEEMESKFKEAVDYINEFEKNNRKTLKTVDIDPGQEHMNEVTNTCIYDGIDSGNNNAQYNYGRLLLSGEKLAKNILEAIKYLEMAAEQKNSFALYKLGTVHLDEESGIKDIPKALEYLIRSSELKNSGAFYKLGTLYLEGKEVEIDKNKAVEYFKEAIKLENDTAMYKLASLYLNGDIIEKDLVEGIKLLESAIEKENHIAMCKMASLKIEGDVIDKDVDGAVDLLEKAVEKKSDNAMYQLGNLYLLGKDIKQDKEEGLKYLNMAILAGNEYAQKFLDYQDWILFNEKLDFAVDLLMIIENRAGGGNDRIRPLTEKSKEEKRAYVNEMGKGGVAYIEHMHEL